MKISIHVLREEDDGHAADTGRRTEEFLSTSSARRTTMWHTCFSAIACSFLSTSSARRTTNSFGFIDLSAKIISIHVLREEDDRWILGYRETPGHFYPRPPRGGRQKPRVKIQRPGEFLSTSSARRTTSRYHSSSTCSNIFLSTSSARRTTCARMVWVLSSCLFLSTSSARRTTAPYP